MKTNSFKIGICLLMALSLLACKKENELAFSTNPTDSSIYVGDKQKVTVESFGVSSSTGYPVSNVQWKVSDNYIASVDADGIVTGLKVGIVQVIGTMSDGKYVFANFNVLGHSYLYIEPKVNAGSVTEIAEYEAQYGRVLVRGSEKEGYLAYKDTIGVLVGNSDYTIYILTKGAISNLTSDSAYTDAIAKFLPERYDYNSADKYFSNPYNVRVYPSKTPLDRTMNYTANNGGSTVAELAAEYKKSAVSYEDKIASASSYSKEALGLTNDIKYDAVDKTAVDKNVSDTKTTIAGSSSISDIEKTLADQTQIMLGLYLDAGKKSALNICRSGLKDGYDENKYYPAVWDSIQIVDAAAQAEIAKATTIRELDQTISSASKGYGIFLPKSTIDSYYKVQAEKEYKSYAETKKEQYDEAGLAQLKQNYDDAIAALEKAYALKDANAALAEQKKADKAVPTIK